MRTLYVMCGLPGAGKSTFIKNFLKDVVIISMDALREELYGTRQDQSHNKEIFQKAKGYLDSTAKEFNGDVVWDATSLTKEHRKIFFEYRDNFDRIICIYCSASWVKCINQQYKRPLEEIVPAKVILNMDKRFEKPSLSEGFDEILTVNSQFKEGSVGG